MTQGRKPVPAALRQQMKTAPKMGVLTPAIPAIPRPLSPEAQAEWDRLTPLLHEASLLTAQDGDALAAYCETLALYREANRLIAEQGMIVPDRDGNPRINPATRILKDALAAMMKFQSDFGITPSARARVKPEAPPREPDAFDLFLAESPGGYTPPVCFDGDGPDEVARPDSHHEPSSGAPEASAEPTG